MQNLIIVLFVLFSSPIYAKEAKALFSGGCFWCMESPFESLAGVNSAVAGFAGGTTPNPTYKEVASGKTDYREAVLITYDDEQISYQKLLEVFWMNIDPTDDGGQFADRGEHYSTAIFYYNEEQRQLAEYSKVQLKQANVFSRPIVTKVIKATSFFPAEDEHQNYYKKNPLTKLKYKMYRKGSGRDSFLSRYWSSKKEFKLSGESKYLCPAKKTLKKNLSELSYKVTQEGATERPFQNAYWDHKEKGIYVDITTGEPLFSSQDKYDSGTGWPSFTKPIQAKNVSQKIDQSHGMSRIEVRSKSGDAHLGHVFKDGPGKNGLRYCINSAALKFIPYNELEKHNLGEYKKLLDQKNKN